MIDYLEFISIYVMGSLEMLMEFWFFTGFLQKKGKPIYSILSVSFRMTVLVVFNLQGIWAFLVLIILLMAAGKLLYRADFVSAALYAVVTVEIMALCFGLFNSLSYILFPVVFVKNPGICGVIFEWGGSTFALVLAVLCCRAVQQCCTCDETAGRKYIFMILMPALSIFLASEYINEKVLDVLLGNKLGIAEGNQIEVRCSLMVPNPCGISDIDFCIILGNALDNAISACSRVSDEKQKYIHVAGKMQGDFMLMEIENSYSGRRMIHSGTGLANIRAAAEKYQGAVEIRTEGEKFLLSILVIIPQQAGYRKQK